MKICPPTFVGVRYRDILLSRNVPLLCDWLWWSQQFLYRRNLYAWAELCILKDSGHQKSPLIWDNVITMVWEWVDHRQPCHCLIHSGLAMWLSVGWNTKLTLQLNLTVLMFVPVNVFCNQIYVLTGCKEYRMFSWRDVWFRIGDLCLSVCKELCDCLRAGLAFWIGWWFDSTMESIISHYLHRIARTRMKQKQSMQLEMQT